VAGLGQITLNGISLPLQPGSRESIEIELLELHERNLLVLDVGLPAIDPDRSMDGPDWGEIALVVRIVTP
jgi:hypothetical protein